MCSSDLAIEVGDAVVDLSNRDVLEITGTDRLGWLHSLTSQHLESLEPGSPFEALILSPNGHVEHVLAGVDDGTRMLAWTEPGRAAALVDFLDSMRLNRSRHGPCSAGLPERIERFGETRG